MVLTDREVLVALYRATGGDRWNRKDGWGTDADISSWHGVTVRDGHVVALRLNNNLQGTIPKELDQLSEVEILYLGNNKLTGFIPMEIGQLSNLVVLNLSNNQLTGTIPKELGQLSKVERLYLDNNNLTGSIPMELGQLSNLVVLNLSNNQLTGLVPLELRRLAHFFFSGNMLDVESRDIHIAKGAVSGKDRLNYKRYAEALAGLFRTGDLDILPTAIGIYAPWGGGNTELQPDANETEIRDGWKNLEWRRCMRTVLLGIWRSALVVILRIMFASLLTWWWVIFSPVVNGFRAILMREVTYSPVDVERPEYQKNRDFIFVELDAWECAGSDILWASLITKIFDSIEGHEQFGWGLVRATRLRNLLLSRKWNWCGLVTVYIIVAIVGVTVVIVINVTDFVAGMNAIEEWATVLLGLPGLLTFLKAFSQLRKAGIFRTTQTILQDAASKRESVGASYRGFMSEVREELEILIGVINKLNADKSNQKAYTLAVIIDDLDRCPKQQIVDMLQATHLLLEQPEAPMAVFLALDPRLIGSAVAEVLHKVPNEVMALEYLDKIIHIPFFLPRKLKRDQKNYLDALLHGEDNSCTNTLRRLRVGRVLHTLEDVTATLGEYDEISRSLIKKVKQGPELLCALRIMRLPQAEKALERFKSEVKFARRLEECERCFEELNAEVTGILLRQDGQMETANEAPTPTSEEKDNDSGEETPSVDQGVFQHGGHAPPQQPETSVGNEDQPSRIASSVLSEAPPRLYVPSVTISMDEKKAFEEIFYFVDTTPRKVKRVVNGYVLQRHIFLQALEQREICESASKRLRQALVKWTLLAELWPMRLSWVVHEMKSSQEPDNETRVNPAKTIMDVYGDETTEGSPCALIHGILIDNEGILGDGSDMKAIYFSDATENGFKRAVRKCKEITKELVLRPGGLLEHSFNLNPTTLTLVENIKLTLIQKEKHRWVWMKRKAAVFCGEV